MKPCKTIQQLQKIQERYTFTACKTLLGFKNFSLNEVKWAVSEVDRMHVCTPGKRATGSTFAKNICKHEPFRMLDSFLVAGLIEARSHERMKLLSIHSPDIELRNLYADLLKSEARHFGIYWKLADERFDRDILTSRLEELAKVESDALLDMHHEPRMHS